MKPKEAFVAVTYRCNSRCSMCNIWRNTEHSEMGPEHYAKLPESLRTINITGGEPFLREDLVEVVQKIHSRVPGARFVFSTNGLMTDKILSDLQSIRRFHPKIAVGVSIDGIKETHDRIRGVPGLFDKAMATLSGLRTQGYDDLRIAMTLQQQNVGEVRKVYDMSRQSGVQFTITLAHNSDIYFMKSDNVPPDLTGSNSKGLDSVVESLLRSVSPKDWLRAYHTAGMYDSAIRRSFQSHCEAGRRYFFMAPNGDIFPCNVLDEPIGNLARAEDWEKAYARERIDGTRVSVRSCARDCWMVCNTRSLIISHPARVAFWIMRKRFSRSADS